MTRTIVKVGHTDTLKRTVETRYSLEDTRHEDRYGESFVAQLHVRTYHDKSGRRYLSSVSRVVASKQIVRVVVTYGQNNPPLPMVGTRVVRHSQKALEAAHEAYMAHLEPILTEALEWAAGAVEENKRS